MGINLRSFDNLNSDKKVYALSMWQGGVSVSQISRDLGCTRQTVYHWVKKSHEHFSKPKSRNRFKIDGQTKNRVIEVFILEKRPSMKRLSKRLSELFRIQLSPSQLRRYLIRWNLYDFRPSVLFDTILREKNFSKAL